MAELLKGLVADLQTLMPAPDLDLTHGNILALDTSLTHNLIVWLGQAQVRTADQEAGANAKLAAMTAELKAYVEANGKETVWKYLNYVNPAQGPISTYGEDNVRFLKKIAAMYDQLAFSRLGYREVSRFLRWCYEIPL
ncbi:FAD binding domain-containing protein [Colletotrichum fioriniae PJ7]|uniref:FAD binding domain-containing protein n=1 Tax=Colletotrichum fioriniae PJ7 TaxID=1445577 RepID=A0A010Q8D6_9PEZI|nr:FAD binding domain-containing protein [Colletotrichum fioriniae PJ7]